MIARSVEPTFAYLIVRTGPRRGQTHQLRPDQTNVGREGDNDILIDDKQVARSHARIRKEDDGEGVYFLYDLASTNGTKVNGQTIVRHALRHDDDIEFGTTRLVFKQL